MQQTKTFITQYKYALVLVFVLPIIILSINYATLNIYLNSSRTVLASDAFAQFSTFHASFIHVLHGKSSLFYTWSLGLGLNYYALAAYYLGSFFNLFLFFTTPSAIPDVLYLLTLLKIATMSLSFFIFARINYKGPTWGIIICSLSYALMSFSMAYSELIMWLDPLIMLPWVMLGIHQFLNMQRTFLLYISYTCLFILNFYFGFMIAIFSGLYFLMYLLFVSNQNHKRSLFYKYILVSILSVGSSMIMLLPTVLDLLFNGESLSKGSLGLTPQLTISNVLAKLMIGVYDTTKFGATPFIYVGLIPLILTLFFFFSKKFSKSYKLFYLILLVLLTFSFYWQPLDLFWQGGHAPNMFLFRYSFLWSFLILDIALCALEKINDTDLPLISSIIILLMFLFLITALSLNKSYVSSLQIIITLLFLICYIICTFLLFYNPKKLLIMILFFISNLEIGLNAHQMLTGILNEWNYPSRSLYTQPIKELSPLVQEASKQTSLPRMQQINPKGPNEAIIYPYASLDYFSSIRNRPAAQLFHDLGFLSRGSNLNLRYANNTLIADSLFNIQYNIARPYEFDKFGFNPITKTDQHTLYDNQYTLGTALITDSSINDIEWNSKTPLNNQQELFNHFSKQNNQYFTRLKPRLIHTKNTQKEATTNRFKLHAKDPNQAQEITFQAIIPAQKQAYLRLTPASYSDIKGTTLSMLTPLTLNQIQMNINSVFYPLGYYPTSQELTITLNISNASSFEILPPDIILLDIPLFTKAYQHIQSKQQTLTINKNKVSGTIHVDQPNSLLWTNIPYDRGWRINTPHEVATLTHFKEGLLMISFLNPGTYDIALTFIPYGFYIGLIISLTSLLLYLLFWWLLFKR